MSDAQPAPATTAAAAPRVRLVFFGECVEGHDPDAVRRAVAQALQLDDARAARLFSGRRVVLRRELEAERAFRHVARFAQLGARVHVEPLGPADAGAPVEAAGSAVPAAAREAPAPAPAAPAVATASATAAADAPAAADVPAAEPDASAAPAPEADTAADEARRRRRRWRDRLRWTAIAVGSVAGGLLLGLVLGPGLAGLQGGARAPAPVAMAPRPVEPEPAPLPAPPVPPPPAPSPATAGADAPPEPVPDPIPADMSAEAMQARERDYLPQRKHKAFAISGSGPFAWHAGARTQDEARAAAIAQCSAQRQRGDDGCRIVDVDGSWGP